MLISVRNSDLTVGREKTYLTALSAAAGTTLTVRGVDSNAWADNDYIIVGEIGANNAEIMQINGAVSDGTSLTVDRSGSGGLRFAHAINEPVYRIDFNNVEFSRATTETGSKTVLTTSELQPDDDFTRYDDTTNTTGFAFVRFKNTTTNGFSPYSDGMPYSGTSPRSLQKMIGLVRTLINEPNQDFISDDEIIEGLNDKQRDLAHERLWTFYEIERSFSSVANQFAYDLPSSIKECHTAAFRTQPLIVIGRARWDAFHWDTDQTSATITYASVWDNQLKLNPRPSSSAGADQLNGAITSSDVTITVDSTSDFKRGDYYRFIIDSEVIYATGSTATTFTGCLRGQEGTTAASHSDDATVTERDIVYTAQVEPTDLADMNDETDVPEPRVLCIGTAADLALKLNKETLHDRLIVRYEKGLVTLRGRYSMKFSGQFPRIKDPRQIVSDPGRPFNGNDYPQGVTSAN
jgi:hypothetical protein